MSEALPPLVAVINTSPEVIELLRWVFEEEGFRTVGDMFTSVRAFRQEEHDLEAFLAREQPAVVVWDIGIPYAENYKYFQDVEQAGTFANCGVVLTTTNKDRLEEMFGPTSAFELVGKPFDLEQIVAAVKRALPAEGA